MNTSTPASSEIVAGQAVPLLNLVNYQDGSVVSRVVLKRERGNVTLFAFDQGQGLSEHTSPYDALLAVLEGEAEIIVGGEPSAVQAGEIILLAADKPHAVRAITRFKMLLTMIRS